MRFDPQIVSDIIADVARQEIMPRFRTLRDDEIKEKEGGELVTVADVAAEKALTRRLQDHLVGSLVIGEEAVAADPAVLGKLSEADPIWIIDPIDGTSNFAGGKPVFAVMVGLVRGDETLAAWIHDPMDDRTLTAQLGAGAWIAGRRLGVGAPDTPLAMRGTLHASNFAPAETARQVQSRRGQVGAIKSLRCAGHEYLRLALGEMQFSLFTKLMPWDHVPGTLIQSEAGGVAWTLDGGPYRASSYKAPGLLMAPDEASWHALRETLFGPD